MPVFSRGLASCAKDKANDSGAVVSARMAQIRSRGRLICGINGQLPGFSVAAGQRGLHRP